MANAEPYLPTTEPFWSDGTFEVYETSNDRFMATRKNGAVHFRGSLKSCAEWILRQSGS